MASILNVDQINNAAGTSAVTIDASTGKPSFPNGATLPAGSVVQVKQSVKTDTQSIATAFAFTQISGLTVNITPTSANSTFVITASVFCGSSYFSYGFLIYKDGVDISHLFFFFFAEFEPFELEAALTNLNIRHALRITSSIKDSEAHYAPLLVWIIGKIVTSSAIAKQNTNPKLSLEKSGIWSSKIASYMNFIRFHSLQKLISLQKNVYELDLTSKGLSKKNFWDDVDRMIISMTTN